MSQLEAPFVVKQEQIVCNGRWIWEGFADKIVTTDTYLDDAISPWLDEGRHGGVAGGSRISSIRRAVIDRQQSGRSHRRSDQSPVRTQRMPHFFSFRSRRCKPSSIPRPRYVCRVISIISRGSVAIDTCRKI